MALISKTAVWRPLRWAWASIAFTTEAQTNAEDDELDKQGFQQLPWEQRQIILLHEALNGRRLGVRRQLLAKMFVYERQLGFSPGGLVVALERDPRFLTTKSCQAPDQVTRNVDCLRAFGFKPGHVEQLLMGAPWILRAPDERLEALLMYFHQSLRLPRNAVANLCAKFPHVASLDLERRIIPCVHYFTRELEMPRPLFLAMMEKFPRLLVVPVDLRIKPIISYFLEDLKMPKERFLLHLRFFPGVLGCSSKRIVQFRARWLQEVTKSDSWIVPHVCLRGLVIFQTKTVILTKSYDALLTALGGDKDLTARILRRVPHVLSWSPGTLLQQLRFIQHRLKRDLTELYHFPSLLGMSFKQQIIPRMNFMEDQGFDYSRCPLFLLFGTSDSTFSKVVMSRPRPAPRQDDHRERERQLTEEMTAFDVEPLQLTPVQPEEIYIPSEDQSGKKEDVLDVEWEEDLD